MPDEDNQQPAGPGPQGPIGYQPPESSINQGPIGPMSDSLPDATMPPLEEMAPNKALEEPEPPKPEELLGAKPPEPTNHQDEPLEGELLEAATEEKQDDGLPHKKNIGLKEIFGHMGLSLKTCLAFIFMVGLIGAVIYYFFFRSFDGETSKVTSDDAVTFEQSEKSEPAGVLPEGVIAALYYGFEVDAISSLTPSIRFGETGAPLEIFVNGIDTALSVGGVKQFTSVDFIKHITILRELNNVYQTDLHALLDASSSRFQVLESHISNFEQALSDAETEYAAMLVELDEIKASYDLVTTEKDAVEAQFFGAIVALNGNESDDFLDQFVVKYKEQVGFKSHYNALAKLNEFYIQALQKSQVRLADIKANFDPLVAGVKVVDIKGSDIDLIEPDAADL